MAHAWKCHGPECNHMATPNSKGGWKCSLTVGRSTGPGCRWAPAICATFFQESWNSLVHASLERNPDVSVSMRVAIHWYFSGYFCWSQRQRDRQIEDYPHAEEGLVSHSQLKKNWIWQSNHFDHWASYSLFRFSFKPSRETAFHCFLSACIWKSCHQSLGVVGVITFTRR